MLYLLTWLLESIQYWSIFVFHQLFRTQFNLRQYFMTNTIVDEYDQFEPVFLTLYSTGHQHQWKKDDKEANVEWYQDMGEHGAVLEYVSLKTRQSYYLMVKQGQYPIDACILLQQSEYFPFNDKQHILYANLKDDYTGEVFDITSHFNKWAGPQGDFSFSGETYIPEMFHWYKQQYNLSQGRISWMNLLGEEHSAEI